MYGAENLVATRLPLTSALCAGLPSPDLPVDLGAVRGSPDLAPGRLPLLFSARLLAVVACLMLPTEAGWAQAQPTPGQASSKSPFRPRRAPVRQDSSEETISTLENELARLWKQAPTETPRYVSPTGIANLARRIASSDDPLQELAHCNPERGFVGVDLKRLTLPAQQLTYRECYVAAELYGRLFRLAPGDPKVDIGSKTVQYLKQYIKLASAREKVLMKLKAEGVPVAGNRTESSRLADDCGEGQEISEYHNGFFCIHFWFSDGHRFTSFVMTPDGELQYATLNVAASIVREACGRPDTPDRAVHFLQEVLRVLPFESQVIRSVQDIPMRVRKGLDAEDIARNKTALEAFLKGKGVSITRPTRAEVYSNPEYVIYVYQRLGGAVIRYHVRCSNVGPVRIRKEIVVRWIGNCRGIQ